MPFIQADRDQTTLLGYSLSDLVEPDAKCRFALSLVQRLDLTALRDRYSNRGAEAFDPAMMLALWFYAYCEGITSTRKLEERCERDTHSIYLSANLRPDHTPQYCGAITPYLRNAKSEIRNLESVLRPPSTLLCPPFTASSAPSSSSLTPSRRTGLA